MDLEACPWCGPQPPVADGAGTCLGAVETFHGTTGELAPPFYVLCGFCHARGPTAHRLKEAERLWNKRIPGEPISTQRLWHLVQSLETGARERDAGSAPDRLFAQGLRAGASRLRAALEGTK